MLNQKGQISNKPPTELTLASSLTGGFPNKVSTAGYMPSIPGRNSSLGPLTQTTYQRGFRNGQFTDVQLSRNNQRRDHFYTQNNDQPYQNNLKNSRNNTNFNSQEIKASFLNSENAESETNISSLKSFKSYFLNKIKKKKEVNFNNEVMRITDYEYPSKEAKMIKINDQSTNALKIEENDVMQNQQHHLNNKKKVNKFQFEFDEETKEIMKLDFERVLYDTRNLSMEQFREKFNDMLERTQTQSTLETEIQRYNDSVKQLEDQKKSTEFAKIKQRQNRSSKFFNSVSKQPNQQLPNDTKKMLHTGNEAFIQELIQFIQAKKGYINRKEIVKQRLINMSLQTNSSFGNSQILSPAANGTLHDLSKPEDSYNLLSTTQEFSKISSNNPLKSRNIVLQSMLSKDSSRERFTNTTTSKLSMNRSQEIQPSKRLRRRDSLIKRFDSESWRPQINNMQQHFQEKIKQSMNVQYKKFNQLLDNISEIDGTSRFESIKLVNQSTDYQDEQQQSKNMKQLPNIIKMLSPDQQWRRIIKDEEFDKLLAKVSKYYGYDPTQIHNVYESLLQQKQMRKKQKMEKAGIMDMDADPNFEKEDKVMSLQALMKDNHMIERYSKYLNKQFFITNDPYIKKKHQQYVQQVNPKKGESFFERMQKDTKKRQENQASQEKERGSSLMDKLKDRIRKMSLRKDMSQMSMGDRSGCDSKAYSPFNITLQMAKGKTFKGADSQQSPFPKKSLQYEPTIQIHSLEE